MVVVVVVRGCRGGRGGCGADRWLWWWWLWWWWLFETRVQEIVVKATLCELAMQPAASENCVPSRPKKNHVVNSDKSTTCPPKKYEPSRPPPDMLMRWCVLTVKPLSSKCAANTTSAPGFTMFCFACPASATRPESQLCRPHHTTYQRGNTVCPKKKKNEQLFHHPRFSDFFNTHPKWKARACLLGEA